MKNTELSFNLIAHAFNAHNSDLTEALTLDSIAEILDHIESINLGCVDWVSDVTVYDNDEAYIDSLDGSPLGNHTVYNLTEQNHVVVVKTPSNDSKEEAAEDDTLYYDYLKHRLLSAYPSIVNTNWMVEKLARHIDEVAPGVPVTPAYLDEHLELYNSVAEFIGKSLMNNGMNQTASASLIYDEKAVVENYNLLKLSLKPGGRVARMRTTVL